VEIVVITYSCREWLEYCCLYLIPVVQCVVAGCDVDFTIDGRGIQTVYIAGGSYPDGVIVYSSVRMGASMYALFWTKL
jgi:hypothetical protein